MLPTLMGARPLTRKRYPKTDDHGAEVIDYAGEPTTIDFRGSVQPAQGQIDLVNRDGAEISYVVWCALTADIKADDVITLSDGDYYVNGAPQRWEQTGTSLDHQLLLMSRWSG